MGVLSGRCEASELATLAAHAQFFQSFLEIATSHFMV